MVQCPGEGFQAKDCKCYCPSGDRDNPLRECDDTDVVTNRPFQSTTFKPVTKPTGSPISGMFFFSITTEVLCIVLIITRKLFTGKMPFSS